MQRCAKYLGFFFLKTWLHLPFLPSFDNFLEERLSETPKLTTGNSKCIRKNQSILLLEWYWNVSCFHMTISLHCTHSYLTVSSGPCQTSVPSPKEEEKEASSQSCGCLHMLRLHSNNLWACRTSISSSVQSNF